jgi:hypothetical protein
MGAFARTPERRILNSWKEIANYLGRGVRTVQRWEAQLGLPVHRPAGKEHSAVLAFSSELDDWLNSRPVRQAMQADGMSVAQGDRGLADLRKLVTRTEEILAKVEVLMSRNDAMQRELARAVESLSTIEKSRREIHPVRVEAAIS